MHNIPTYDEASEGYDFLPELVSPDEGYDDVPELIGIDENDVYEPGHEYDYDVIIYIDDVAYTYIMPSNSKRSTRTCIEILAI